MSDYGTLQDRVRHKSLLSKVMSPEDTIQFFKPGMNLGWSGFTPAGYPKVVPIALADHVEKNNLQGKWKFNLFIGASVGAETEDRWASLDMIDRRWPYQTGKNIAAGINAGRIRMGDKHLSLFAQDLGYGYYTKDTESGKLDLAIIEVSAITEDGALVPTTSCGVIPEILMICDKIIVEVNTGQPSFEGIHDLISPKHPPFREVFNITRADSRIGSTSIPCDPSKIVAVVESKLRDKGRAFAEQDDTSEAIANHILDFFKYEVKSGRIPDNLLPLQSGVGSIANAVVGGLAKGPFYNLTVFTEVLQDTMLDLFDSGRLDAASSCSLSLSENPGFPRFFENWEKYFSKITLRPLSISNAPEPIRRLGCIAMNTPVEIDIYAHANSTLVGGTRMINGLGGSGDFLRNGKIKLMHTPSSRPSKTDPNGISCVVPHCSHIDHTEHDLDVVVTEQGLADLRGLAPKDRAKLIIEKCAHPDYKPILQEYLDIASKDCLARKVGHEPQMWDRAFKMHLNLEKNGTMKIKNWDVKIDLCE
ncbi:acetyl-CoA hydrolase/transferase C-terminal domain-containing protein [Geobacter sp. SVR]|uniref:acetyl-CoA hydrolase/transferase C-terminal domain-containing protein n=1 Tax=Geobacter sp. SVR TaxID=2495594 RepID=UPI00143F0532|nr:acetyl-CoA hydrolase/transferase C-terminal domain-containing protein [Geobacter sp. SVR]BCS51751.1 acetyl-CoA hydrolase [Geobacter sp. SVR]GCF84938.1 acetyl-CoA hydrolase [Geobacter sp. SVR]